MAWEASGPEPARSSPHRIFLIDGEAAIRALLRRQLEQAGYVVLDAADGRTGIAATGHQPTDIVLTDIFMPRERRHRGHSRSQVLLVEGQDHRDDRRTVERFV